MIVRFLRWRDKLRVLEDGRDPLRQQNISVAADLTRKQRDTITKYRSRGIHAYYRGNQLVESGPLRSRRGDGQHHDDGSSGAAHGGQDQELSGWESESHDTQLHEQAETTHDNNTPDSASRDPPRRGRQNNRSGQSDGARGSRGGARASHSRKAAASGGPRTRLASSTQGSA
ncbi:hypothetical protein BaRGS_00001704 [Batillaria attramentaria]|uniref:Uncharacterized protein n=1 Tax=Batillaria attramentaria TaxID=370345 RepID=A0ABD0M6P2_9CAEN